MVTSMMFCISTKEAESVLCSIEVDEVASPVITIKDDVSLSFMYDVTLTNVVVSEVAVKVLGCINPMNLLSFIQKADDALNIYIVFGGDSNPIILVE